ncbi:MAG: hypothetical protein ABI315_16310 [Bacteroidia bacterium]
MLKYNTLYQSLKKISVEWHASIPQWEYYWYVFKFFEDGTFIYSRTTEKGLENIKSWFTKENINITKGLFEYNLLKENLKINLNDVSLYASITFENNLLLEGKLAWDMFSPID